MKKKKYVSPVISIYRVELEKSIVTNVSANNIGFDDMNDMDWIDGGELSSANSSGGDIYVPAWEW
jgi:hypothetical protein